MHLGCSFSHLFIPTERDARCLVSTSTSTSVATSSASSTSEATSSTTTRRFLAAASDILRALLTLAVIEPLGEVNLGALLQCASIHDGRDMAEEILTAVVGADEAESAVVPALGDPRHLAIRTGILTSIALTAAAVAAVLVPAVVPVVPAVVPVVAAVVPVVAAVVAAVVFTLLTALLITGFIVGHGSSRLVSLMKVERKTKRKRSLIITLIMDTHLGSGMRQSSERESLRHKRAGHSGSHVTTLCCVRPLPTGPSLLTGRDPSVPRGRGARRASIMGASSERSTWGEMRDDASVSATCVAWLCDGAPIRNGVASSTTLFVSLRVRERSTGDHQSRDQTPPTKSGGREGITIKFLRHPCFFG